MSWINRYESASRTKKIIINSTFIFILTIFFITFLELISGLGRALIGKEFHIPFANYFETSIDMYGKGQTHPCIEMETDLYLSHRPYTRGKCLINGGYIIDDWVIYDEYDPNKSTVMILGGSTTSGFYQGFAKGETWPKIFKDFIGKNANVINGGVGGYSSTNELMKLVKYGNRVNNLKLVISLNGINDISDDSLTSRKHPNMTRKQYFMDKQQTWVDSRTSSHIRSILPNMHSFIDLVGRRLNLETNELPAIDSDVPLKVYKPLDSANRWESNLRRMRNLARSENAEYIVFLQPTMGLFGTQSEATPGTNDFNILTDLKANNTAYIDQLNEAYEKFRTICSRLDFCYDISQIATPSGSNYSDARHHNQNGNKIIATEIFNTIDLRKLVLVD